MSSPESTYIRKTLVKDHVRPGVSLQQERSEWETYASTLPLPKGVSLQEETIVGVHCLWVSNKAPHDEIVLYVHGGGLISGSSGTHREFAARLTRHLERAVLLVDYRLAPEHPFPAGLNDVINVYRELQGRNEPAPRIVIGGDSTGAGLALAAMLKLKESRCALPHAAFFISGHFDMTLSGESLVTHREIDPLTSEDALARAVELYANGMDASAPLISPLFGDLSNLPPILIQVGDHEILLSDSIRLAERARNRGGSAELRVWPEMWHVWPMWPGMPESVGAMLEIRQFLDRR